MAPIFMFVPMVIIYFIVGNVFLLFTHSIFFTTLNTVVTEKETRLKENMQMIGLNSAVFWLSHWISICCVVFVNSLVTCIIGFAMGFSLFTRVHFLIIWCFFFLYGVSSVAFALFISSVTPTVKIAIGGGFFAVIIAIIDCSVGTASAYAWYSDPNSSDSVYNAGWIVLMWFPFFSYVKMMQDILTYVATQYNVTKYSCTLRQGTWFGYTELTSQLPPSDSQYVWDRKFIPVPGQSLGFFIWNTIFWIAMAWYFDKVTFI